MSSMLKISILPLNAVANLFDHGSWSKLIVIYGIRRSKALKEISNRTDTANTDADPNHILPQLNSSGVINFLGAFQIAIGCRTRMIVPDAFYLSEKTFWLFSFQAITVLWFRQNSRVLVARISPLFCCSSGS